jgi:hypothetical protein
MKIYKYEPTYFVRLQICKLKEQTEYLTLHETTIEEVNEMCMNIVTSQGLTPFEKGLKTSINIREATGAINGKSTSLSFRGISPAKVKELIVNYIESNYK